MNITFNRLTITNFKSHATLTVDFSDITRIEGTNGAGKSSIGDSITWTLFGTDTLGTKMDPTPIAGASTVNAELLLTVDEKQLLLSREIATGKNKFYVNEIPSKATEYSALVESLFNKDLFLSLFNPTYFFTQHWETQRSQLLSYVSEPTNKEVLDQLTPVHRERLGEALKKHSLDDLDKKHRDNKLKAGKEYERMRGVMQAHEQTYQECVDRSKSIEFSIDELYERANKLQSEIEGHSELIRAQQDYDRTMIQLEAQYKAKGEEMQRESDAYKALKTQEINETCVACGQPLADDAVAKSHDHHATIVQKQFEKAKGVVGLYKTIGEKLEAHKAIPRQVVPDISELHKLEREADDSIHILETLKKSQAYLDETRTKFQAVAKSHTESEFMVDYIKDFRAKRAEITAQKVSELFSTLSVRFYNTTKDGDQKPTFEIEMNGVPYSKLSTAEKIKAGLELINVLAEQSGAIAPVFVDNAESIIRFGKPAGQLILARVQDCELKITTDYLEGAVVNE